MKSYDKLPLLKSSQIKTFLGSHGQIVRNSDTDRIVFFDGKKTGGYEFADTDQLDSFLRSGVLPSEPVQETNEVVEEEAAQGEQVDDSSDESVESTEQEDGYSEASKY